MSPNSTLTFPQADLRHAGRYECAATNQVGTAIAAIDVQVDGMRMLIMLICHKLYFSTHQHVCIVCLSIYIG